MSMTNPLSFFSLPYSSSWHVIQTNKLYCLIHSLLRIRVSSSDRLGGGILVRVDSLLSSLNLPIHDLGRNKKVSTQREIPQGPPATQLNRQNSEVRVQNGQHSASHSSRNSFSDDGTVISHTTSRNGRRSVPEADLRSIRSFGTSITERTQGKVSYSTRKNSKPSLRETWKVTSKKMKVLIAISFVTLLTLGSAFTFANWDQ